jgi:hypothetical protein
LSAYLDSSCLSAGSGTLSSSTASTNSTGYAEFSSVFYNRAQTIFLQASSGMYI